MDAEKHSICGGVVAGEADISSIPGGLAQMEAENPSIRQEDPTPAVILARCLFLAE